MTLPRANCIRIIRNAGATRVSEDAGTQLGLLLDEMGTNVAEYAIQLANHAGRKTVKLEDIQLASDAILS